MGSADITLVNVSLPENSGENGGRTETYVPLGCLCLMSSLKRAGYRVDFRDYQLFSCSVPYPLDPGLLVDFLSDSAPILGVSCMVSMLPFVLLATKEFKQIRPDCTIILGGPGPSGVAQEIVKNMPWIDIVVVGEGEQTLLELMRVLHCGIGLSEIEGIAYREGGSVRLNPKRGRIEDLDSLGIPSYEEIDLRLYTNVSVVTGRGCPFKCTFCDVSPLWNNRVVLRSPGSVEREIDILGSQYGIKRVNIVDDTFTIIKGRTLEICNLLEKKELSWSCLSRVDSLDEKLLCKMKDAGCDSIYLGIESGSNRVLERIKKNFTIEEAAEKVDIAVKYMDKVVTSFMWGFPFETMDEFKMTLSSMIAMWHLGAMTGLMLVSPMPLSEIGREYKDKLAFSEDLCSVFASRGNFVIGQKRRRVQLPEAFIQLILEYPEIFCGFYFIQSETIWEKLAYLESFCRRFGLEV